MKVLIIHNILWAHYKSILFENLEKFKNPNMEIEVLQIAKNELSRKNLGEVNYKANYNYHLLFDDYIEHISTVKKTINVCRYIFQSKADIINFNGLGVDFSISFSIFFAFLLRKKIIISNESNSLNLNKLSLKYWIKKVLVKISNAFIVFGHTSADYLIKLGAHKSDILVNKAACVDDITLRRVFEDSKNFDSFSDVIKTKHNFIFVGRLSPEKNIISLIKSFQLMCNETDWGLIIVGDGILKNEIEEIVKPNSDRIYLFESVNWQQIPVFFSYAQCLVLPSSYEPWGLVVNEAMICGLSIISSNMCGCNDDLVKDNGIIFDFNKKEALKEALKKIANQSEEQKATRQNLSLSIIEEFKVGTVAKKIINAFKIVYAN